MVAEAEVGLENIWHSLVVKLHAPGSARFQMRLHSFQTTRPLSWHHNNAVAPAHVTLARRGIGTVNNSR